MRKKKDLHTKKSAHLKPKKEVYKILHEGSVEKILVENFVSLQKVMTHLSISFDNLANQLSKLLELFEISAKTLAEKELKPEKNDKEILEKMNNLLEQNKIIARGVSLIHEKAPFNPDTNTEFGPPIRRETQGFGGGYQRSISSNEQQEPSSLTNDEQEENA
ncbi:hypothetical protein COU58_04545 [Candidatus Pacearchaeota archaeon CG10_big_fil_rev_8_21_14_0_10_32_42]|nr:MAG: hypothetical protein COU58_04545 [Candidatus Pacearchaeota archaeon CG10_big_fil_rev_8_21_14_0_10_32_42]